MTRRVLVAPDEVEAPLEGPLIYLDGPIRGAYNWHREALSVLAQFAPEVHVASPRSRAWKGKYEQQLAWEAKYLERAARSGVILYWMAKEHHHRCNRAYAQAARFQLGEWCARSRVGLARLVVGIEKGFTGGPYLRRRLTLAYPNVPVCRSLRQTCVAAAELAQSAPVAYSLADLLRPMMMQLPSLPDRLRGNRED